MIEAFTFDAVSLGGPVSTWSSSRMNADYLRALDERRHRGAAARVATFG